MRLLLVAALALAACSRADKPAAGKSPAQAAAPASDLRAKCCGQCGGAASRDPSGMDISGKTCTSYPAEWNTGPGVDDECRAWFVAQPQPLTVGDCRTP